MLFIMDVIYNQCRQMFDCLVILLYYLYIFECKFGHSKNSGPNPQTFLFLIGGTFDMGYLFDSPRQIIVTATLSKLIALFQHCEG